MLLALCVGCSTTDPATGRKTRNMYSIEDDISMGAAAFEDVKQWARDAGIPINQDAAQVARLEQMMRNIAAVSHRPGLPYEVALLHSDIVNAMAMPGGKFVVFEGLYDPEHGLVRDDDALAFVMAHEIAHVNLRHSTEALTRHLPAQLILMGGLIYAEYKDKDEWELALSGAFVLYGGLVMTQYSRKHEEEADRFGMLYMAQAGYDPRSAVRLWRRAAENESKWDRKLSFLSTHPPSSQRARRLERRLPAALALYEVAGETRMAQAPDRAPTVLPASRPPPGPAPAVSPASQSLAFQPPPPSATAPPRFAPPTLPAPPVAPVATGASVQLAVRTPAVLRGERIVVVHSPVEITDRNAWIGFYDRLDAADTDYLSYTFLLNLNDQLYDVIAPARLGAEYHFRIFLTDGAAPTAHSDCVEVK